MKRSYFDPTYKYKWSRNARTNPGEQSFALYASKTSPVLVNRAYTNLRFVKNARTKRTLRYCPQGAGLACVQSEALLARSAYFALLSPNGESIKSSICGCKYKSPICKKLQSKVHQECTYKALLCSCFAKALRTNLRFNAFSVIECTNIVQKLCTLRFLLALFRTKQSFVRAYFVSTNKALLCTKKC